MSKEQVIEVAAVSQTACGMYRVAIVDSKTGQIKWEMPEWRHNLILNSGMEMVATNAWVKCISNCYAGTSSTSNYKDSGTDTAASDASGNVTSVGATVDFTTFANGDCILWDDGSQGRITSRPTANTCTIVPAPGGSGISSGFFTVLKTSNRKLYANTAHNSSLLPNSPNSIAQRIGNLLTSRFTFDFPSEVGPVTYNEIGLTANSGTPASNPDMFSRIVLPAPVILGVGDSLRVIYQLQLTVAQTDPVPVTPTISGWPVAPAITTSGTFALVEVGLSAANTAATSSANAVTSFSASSQLSNEPSSIAGNYYFWVDKTRLGFGFSWPSPGTDRSATRLLSDYEQGAISHQDFSALTYFVVKEATWAIATANVDSWGNVKAVGFGYSFFTEPSIRCGSYFEFDQDQTKTNVQKLTLRFKYSWSRVLTID
jgi:hypothetical protein